MKLIHQLCYRSYWAQDDVAACTTWIYRGFPLSPAVSLPPKLELKEVEICGKNGSVGIWWSWFDVRTIAIIKWILCMYIHVHIEFSYQTVGDLLQKLQSRSIQTIGIWDRWIIVNLACFLEACNEAFKKPEVSNSPLYFVPWVSAVQVLPWRNWKHWDVDDAHLKRLDPWLQMKPDVSNTILLTPYKNLTPFDVHILME